MKHFLGLCVLFLSLSVAAQNEDYKKMADELEQRIFGTPDTAFASNTVPDFYKNESAVIIAKKISLETSSKKVGSFFVNRSARTMFNFLNIYREKILLNDKSALDEYSELTFTELQEKNKTIVGNYKNYSFVNIRLIKPDGSVHKINVDEAVALEGRNNKKKIAIPGLSVGDILDFYSVKYYDINSAQQRELPNESTEILAENYPVINYELSFLLDERFAAEYQTINGAPAFEATRNDERHNFMVLKARHLPKLKDILWYSIPRQMPIVRVKYTAGYIYRKNNPSIPPGRVEEATKYETLTEAKFGDIIANIFTSQARMGSPNYSRGFGNFRDQFRDAYKQYKRKHLQADNNDSLISFLHRYTRWNNFYTDFNLETDFSTPFIEHGLYHQILSCLQFAFTLEKEYKIPSDIVIVTGRNSVTRENIFDVTDLSVMVRAGEKKQRYFYFGTGLYQENEIPASFEGENAKVIYFNFSRSEIGFDQGKVITLPQSAHKDNSKIESLRVKLDEANPEQMLIYRNQQATGIQRRDQQAWLGLFEDAAMEAGWSVGENKTLLEINDDRNKKSRKQADELASVIKKARTEKKKAFESEIESSYGTAAKELKDFKIVSLGSMPGQPVFEMEQNFVMEGWVKKAGNNYIVDAGKLITEQLELKPDQRERKISVYMPYPRSYSYQIELEIPEGFTAEGLDKFNRKVENVSGGFVTTARTENNKVLITAEKWYTKSWEPVENWPNITAFIDEAFQFTKEKILLRKK